MHAIDIQGQEKNKDWVCHTVMHLILALGLQKELSFGKGRIKALKYTL